MVMIYSIYYSKKLLSYNFYIKDINYHRQNVKSLINGRFAFVFIYEQDRKL